jgi:sulfofructosephosphate aldolase
MTSAAAASLKQLQLPGGGYAMLAIDQRESLRTMMAAVRSEDVTDDGVVAFKRSAVEILAPHASAVLVDRQSSLRVGLPDGDPRCGLILAADIFAQAPGGPVEDSDVDPAVTVQFAQQAGADALKLLVLWRAGESRGRRDDLVGRFMALGAGAGLPTVLEGIVRPPAGRDWAAPAERDDAIQAAAGEFAQSEPDLYKAEVPGLGQLPAEQLKSRAQALTTTLGCPWVVLSSGVPAELFPGAVAAACAGGASGFLAGRAIWADSLPQPDMAASLREQAVSRLTRLAEIVRSSLPPA